MEVQFAINAAGEMIGMDTFASESGYPSRRERFRITAVYNNTTTTPSTPWPGCSFHTRGTEILTTTIYQAKYPMSGLRDKLHLFLPVLLTVVVMVPAQVRDTASMFGTVTDAQAAVVTSAKVGITNVATGLSRSVITDTSGGFVFPLLPVGTYNLSVEQPGFRKYERRGILLQANENIRVDVLR
jgi:hypothetical protein